MGQVSKTLELAVPMHVENVRHAFPEWAAGVEKELGQLVGHGELFEQSVAKVEGSGDFTEDGRSRQIQKLADVALTFVKEFENRLVGALDDRRVAMEAELFSNIRPKRPSDPAERLAYELQLQQVRASFAEIPPQERQVAYHGIEDPLVLDAIENSPPVLTRAGTDGRGLAKFQPLIDPKVVAKARVDRARATSPEKAHLIEGLEMLASIYKQSAGILRQPILKVKQAAEAVLVAHRKQERLGPREFTQNVVVRGS